MKLDKGILTFVVIQHRVFPLLTAIACLVVAIAAAKERIYFAEFEHIEATYWNRKYLVYANVSARRYSRRDPTHYINAHFETLVPLGNNVTIDWYFYEFLSNEYRRSFVEAHDVDLCEIVLSDKVYGQYIKEKLNHAFKMCPFPKAVYHVENISVPNMPLLATFPFQKGRLYVNWTLALPNGSKEKLARVYVDATIKTKWRQ